MFIGKDCIGCAKTGSGKTAAFALPILQRLAEDPFGIYALVLTPTRFVFVCIYVYVCLCLCSCLYYYNLLIYQRISISNCGSV